MICSIQTSDSDSYIVSASNMEEIQVKVYFNISAIRQDNNTYILIYRL